MSCNILFCCLNIFFFKNIEFRCYHFSLVQIFINNEFVSSVSGKTFPTVDPSTGKKICDIQEGEKVRHIFFRNLLKNIKSNIILVTGKLLQKRGQVPDLLLFPAFLLCIVI